MLSRLLFISLHYVTTLELEKITPLVIFLEQIVIILQWPLSVGTCFNKNMMHLI
jgi:hypothetical protein